MSSDLLDQVLNGTISHDEFEKEIWILSTGVKRTGRSYNGTENNPIRIFRSRLFESEKLPIALNEYSYPPSEYCSIGRANENKVPVFYASAGGPTTFVESRCKVGDIIVVSEYRCHHKLVVQEIGFANNLNEASEYEQIIYEIFTYSGDKYYKYSSKLASHLMKGPELHGITYPSIISNNQSQNLALKADFADQFLTLINCTAYKIKNITDTFSYEVEQFNFGVNNHNSIIWKGRKKQWTIKENGAELQMKANGWQWDAYDINNKLVDPE